MSYTIDNRPLLSLALDVPLRGAWTARAEHSGSEPLTGRVALVIGSETWQGAVVSSQVDGAGTVRSLLVGGAGGLRTMVAPRWSDVATYALGDLTRELASLGGETYGGAPLVPVPRYQRAASTVGAALDALATATDTRWRIGADGAVALSLDTAPEVEADAPGQLLSRDATASTYSATDGVDLVGHVVDGLPVRHQYITAADSSVRITIERETPTFRADQNRPLRDVYRGRVVAQIGSSVDIAADGWALSRVPLYLGVAGASVMLTPGTEILYMFADGDPTQPIAMLAPNAALSPVSVSFEAALGATKLTIDALGVSAQTVPFPALPLVRTGDQVILTSTSTPLIPGVPVPVIVGPSLSQVNGLPSTLKSS